MIEAAREYEREREKEKKEKGVSARQEGGIVEGVEKSTRGVLFS